MEPAASNDRRHALMKRLTDFAHRGVEHEVRLLEQKRRKTASDSRPFGIWSAQIFHLHNVIPGKTIAMLESYSTQALELMAERFTAIKNETDYLHRWLSYNGREWNTVTGEHRDAMFCDLMVLTRSGGFSQAESWVHSLLDTYRYLGLEPGSILVMAPEEMKTVVEPVFNLASASRSRVWLRRGVEAKQFDRSGRWIPPVEPEEVHEDYTRTHLTLEAVEYVSGFPERTGAWHST